MFVRLFLLFDIILDDQSKGMDIVCVNSNARTVVNGSVSYVHLIGKSILTNPATLKSVWPMTDKMEIFFKDSHRISNSDAICYE